MARKKTPVRDDPRIELDTLLNGTPTWADVVDFWQKGQFDDEHYLVAAIKKHLLTPGQREFFHKFDISIEDALNGRVASEAANFALDNIFNEWNAKLGFKSFGFSR